jgi:hypothetical protein
MVHIPAHKNLSQPAGQVSGQSGVFPKRALPKPGFISVESGPAGFAKAEAEAFLAYYRRQHP